MPHEKIQIIRNFIDDSLHPDTTELLHPQESFLKITVQINRTTTVIEFEPAFITNTELNHLNDKLLEIDLTNKILHSKGKSILVTNNSVDYTC